MTNEDDSVCPRDAADQISRKDEVPFWWKYVSLLGKIEAINPDDMPKLLAEHRKRTLKEVRKTIIDSYRKEYGGVIFFSKALDLIDSMINE